MIESSRTRKETEHHLTLIQNRIRCLERQEQELRKNFMKQQQTRK